MFFSQILLAINIKYPVSAIPDNLKQHADAVIRYQEIKKEITSDSRVITEETFVVTIFNKSAQNLGYFYEIYDKLSSVNSYSVKLYNKYGNLIDKSKSSDFKDVKAYDGFTLFDDNRMIYYKSYSSDYPYTIEYNYKRIDKQTLNIGNWLPVSNYDIAVQESNYTLVTDESNPIRFKELNLPETGKVNKIKDKSIYTWSLRNFEAIQKQPFMPNSEYILPKVRIASDKFSYEGFEGNSNTWQSLGAWNWELIKDQITLPQETVLLIKNMIDTIETTREKVALLYKYLQNNTRYVSIQLGIGGYQPIDATEVDETKYGDCKGLSNYMRALLEVANIKSDYAIVRAGHHAQDMLIDFPSNQFNHAILSIPDNTDTIWLECTSQKIPFGFLGSFTDNRHCLLVTPEGGKIAKTPEYKQESNTQHSTTVCQVDDPS